MTAPPFSELKASQGEGISLRAQPYNDCVTSSVPREVLHAVTQGAVPSEFPELAFEVGELRDAHRLIRRPAGHTDNESRERRRNCDDRANFAGDFFDVDTGVGWGDEHESTLLLGKCMHLELNSNFLGSYVYELS